MHSKSIEFLFKWLEKYGNCNRNARQIQYWYTKKSKIMRFRHQKIQHVKVKKNIGCTSESNLQNILIFFRDVNFENFYLGDLIAFCFQKLFPVLYCTLYLRFFPESLHPLVRGKIKLWSKYVIENCRLLLRMKV